MRHITIAYKCEHRPDGRWAPGFELTLVESFRIQNTRKFSDVDSTLTCRPNEEAELSAKERNPAWSCSDNYPGWE